MLEIWWDWPWTSGAMVRMRLRADMVSPPSRLVGRLDRRVVKASLPGTAAYTAVI